MSGAGVFSGLQCFIDSIMYASSVFPGSPDLAIAIQSSLLGYALMQLVVTRFSGVRVLIAPVSYEVIPFLKSLSAIVGAALPVAAATPTMLAASCVVNGLAALLFWLLSFLPIGAGLARLLPPVLQSGIMATVGWGIYTLSYDGMGVAGPEAALAEGSLASLTEGAHLWLPAHALGIGLWLASRQTSHPALFPTFAVLLTALCAASPHTAAIRPAAAPCALNVRPSLPARGRTHAVRLASGTSLAEARAAHWLMDEAEGQPFWTLWSKGLLSGGVRWDVLLQPDALYELVRACTAATTTATTTAHA
jgi:hypothetical protein